MSNLFSSILDSVGRFIVSGRAGTFTHFDRVVHISCRFIHLVQVFFITVQVTIRACSLSDSSHKEWVSLLRRRGDLDSHSHLSTFSLRLLLVVDIVESVEKLSPFTVDNLDIVIGVVESVEKLSPFFVDNSDIVISVVESVEKLSTDNVEKWKREKKEKNHQVIHSKCG